LNLPLQDEIITTNNVSFNYSVYDYVDSVVSCELYLGGDVEDSSNVTSGEDNLVYIPVSDGNYSWYVTCFDEVNNSNQTASQNFSVVAPPNVTLDNPANDFLTTSSSITFVYTPTDAIGITNCDFYLDGIFNETDSSIFANNPNNFTINGITEGEHNWSVECFDFDSNSFMPTPKNFTRDVSPPEIILEAPDDEAGIDINEGEIYFTWKAIDTYDEVLQCNLTVGGSVLEENQWVSNNISNTERITGLGIGEYEWNVTCWDQMQNVNTSESRTFNLTYPDFEVLGISFNESSFYEGQNILINSTIKNSGGADAQSVIVSFFNGDPDDGGINIENKTIDLNKSEIVFVTSEFTGEIGENEIFVFVDYADFFVELNEGNNEANETINIGSWQFFYGDILSTSEYELNDEASDNLIAWDAVNFKNGNLFVTDYEASVSWNDLIEIGKDINGDNSTNDFGEIDSVINMSGYSDSVSEVYTTGGVANNFSSFVVFVETLLNVPIVESINNSNFVTGVLWDSNEDGNGEFDSTEREDLIFVAKVNPDSVGTYGIYDYELRVPARLREYDNTNSESVIFYVEIW
jgi:hypothetical protein